VLCTFSSEKTHRLIREGNMAFPTLFGPLLFDFGPNGLRPGETFGTVWDIEPELIAGTVTLTAIPDPGAGDGAWLATRDPTVQVRANPTGPSSHTFFFHVDVVNVGQETVFNAKMFISYVRQ
jgi:hypothetical protein